MTEVYPQISQQISKCLSNLELPVLGGMNIYSLSAPKANSSTYTAEGHTIKVDLVKKLNLADRPELFLSFMNNAMSVAMRQKGYAGIGKSGKYFRMDRRKKIDSASIYPGFRLNFLRK